MDKTKCKGTEKENKRKLVSRKSDNINSTFVLKKEEY